MKVGDLVTFGRHNGVIVEDHTMMCEWNTDTPYRMGAMMVLSDGIIKRVVYANLKLAK